MKTIKLFLGISLTKFQRAYQFFPSDSLNTTRAPDLTKCCYLCSAENACKIVSYNTTSKDCDFHAQEFWKPTAAPSNYLVYYAGESYFELVKVPMTRQEAKLSCESKGVHLVKIYTEAKQVEPTHMLQKITISTAENAYAFPWTGGEYVPSKGDFYWSDGSPVSTGYKGWNTDQPDNFGGIEDCIHLQSRNFNWNDISCSGYFWSICEYE